MAHTDIVFAGPPGPDAGRFVEVEDGSGKNIRFGEWIQRADGFWVLRIAASARLIAAAPDLLAALNTVLDQVDYMADPPNCLLNDPVGAMLPKEVIALARAAIAKAEGG